MDQRLPSGQPPDVAPPTAPSDISKQVPEKSSHLETKQDSKLENSLVAHLQNNVVSAGDSAGRNGDIDATNELIKGKEKPHPQVDSRKETITPVSKTEFDSKKSSSPKKSECPKITSIQFAEFPLEGTLTSPRILRDPEMKSDLQRSSTVPEISLRKEPSEETVTVATIANADIATIAASGSSTLLDWNSESRTLYRNNVEMRSVGNLALHSTIEEESGYRSDKYEEEVEVDSDVSKVTSKATTSSESNMVKTIITTTVSTNKNGFVEGKAEEKKSSTTVPSKCEVSHNHIASPSHVTISFPKDVSKTEVSINNVEKVSDSIAKSSLPHASITSLEQVPVILDQIPESKNKMSSEMPFSAKDEPISETALSSKITKQTDESCKQSVSVKKEQEVAKEHISKEKSSSPALPSEKKELVDITKVHLEPEQSEIKDIDKAGLGKTVTICEEKSKKDQVSLAEPLKGVGTEKGTDKSKDDKKPSLEKEAEETSKSSATTDQTKPSILSSIQDTKDQARSNIMISKKESNVLLVEEFKSELLPSVSKETVKDKTKEIQQKETENLPSSEVKDSKLQPQLTTDKSKITESLPIESDKVQATRAIISVVETTESKEKLHPTGKNGKPNGPLTDSFLQKCESSIKGAESKQNKDSFNLEQKYLQSDLTNGVLKNTPIPPKEKEVLVPDSIKTVKEVTVTKKEKHDTEIPPSKTFEETQTLKDESVISKDLPVEVIPLVKEEILQKMKDPSDKVEESVESKQKQVESDISKEELPDQETKQPLTKKSEIISKEPEIKSKGFDSVKPETVKVTSLIEDSSITLKQIERPKDFQSKDVMQNTSDVIQYESKKENLSAKDKVTLTKSVDQQPYTLTIRENSVQPIEKEDKIDKNHVLVSTQDISKETSIQPKDSFLTANIEDEKKQIVTTQVKMESVPPQKVESVQKEAISIEKKSETVTSAETTTVVSQKEISPKKKSDDKMPLDPKIVASKTTISPVNDIKETKESVISEKKVPSSSLSQAKTKESNKICIESILPITADKENISKNIEKVPESSVLQVISNDKTPPEIQYVEKEDIPKAETIFESKKQLADLEAKTTDILAKEKEKAISFISKFASDTDIPKETKTEISKEKEKQTAPTVDKLPPGYCLSKKDEKADSQQTTIQTEIKKSLPPEALITTDTKTNKEEKSSVTPSVSIETKTVRPIATNGKAEQEAKPNNLKKDDVIVPTLVKVPDKKPDKEDELVNLQSQLPVLEKEPKITSTESSKEAEFILQKQKDSQPTVSGPSKEPEKLEGQSKDKKDIEIPKLQPDTPKEKTVIEVSVTSKTTEVQLHSLDVSGETKPKEVPITQEMKQTKEPFTYSADNVQQHKRIESVVPKENVIQQSRIDSRNTESNELSSLRIKDQKEGALEEKQIEPSHKLIDSTIDKEMVTEPSELVPSVSTKEVVLQIPVPKDTVPTETAISNVASEPSMKVTSTITSLVSRDNDINLPCIIDDKVSSPNVPSVTQEESKSDGAKEIKIEEERPIQVPEENAQDNTLLGDDNLDNEAVLIDQSSTDVEKGTDLPETTKTGKDITIKQAIVNNRKTLPITVNGLVPHLDDSKKVDLSDKQEKKGHDQKIEENVTESKEGKFDESTDSSGMIKPVDISDKQKPVEISKEVTMPDIAILANRDNQDEKIIEQNTIEDGADLEELSDAKDTEQKSSADEGTKPESENISDTGANLKEETMLSPKKKKLIPKPEEVRGIRSSSPHKENGQTRRRLHKRSKSRDKPEISTKQDNKEIEKQENEEEKLAHDAVQKSPKKRRLRRAHRSMEEKETSSVPDSSKIPTSPVKKPSTAPAQKGLTSPKKTPYSRNGLLSPTKSLKGDKKLPPIKAAVGFAPNPNLKNIKSKIGSFDNIHYKPKGGDKKVITAKKLEWNASSKVKSLENTNYRPGGGDKKIITQKLEFKEKAQAKSVDSESDTDAIEIAKKKDANEDEAPTTEAPAATEAQESKDLDSFEATGGTSEDQEVTA